MNDDDDKDLRNDWYPTPEEFSEYQDRDTVLCGDNLRVILRAANRPLPLKDLKDSCLHNSSTVELALRMALSAGSIRELPGKVPTFTLSV